MRLHGRSGGGEQGGGAGGGRARALTPALERPGIMPMIWPTGPIFWMLANCSYRMRMENAPFCMLSSSSSFICSSGTASCAAAGGLAAAR